MKYRFLFYKSKWGDKHIIDNVISLVTLCYNWFSPDASHVEVWLPDKEMGWKLYYRKVSSFPQYQGTCFTSTMRGDDNGTVMRPASDVLKNPSRWYYYEVECDKQVFEDAEFAAQVKCKNNKGYGKRTLLKFVGINWPDPDRAICSEICHWFGCITGVFKGKPKVVSPRRLSKMLKKLGYEPKSL